MPKKVLIVEDDASIVKLIEASIGTLGIQCNFTSAPSGEEAMLSVILDRPDLLIIDLGLPGMSGWDLIQLVRKRNSAMSVIIITGHRDESVLRRSKEMGLDGCFFKPLVMKVFLKKVESVLFEQGPEKLHKEVPQPQKKITSALEAIVESTTKTEEPTTSRIIQTLYESLGAVSVTLLGETGHVILRAGADLNQYLRPGWETTVLASLSATKGMSRLLQDAEDHQVQTFQSREHTLLLGPMERGGLLALLESKAFSAQRSKLIDLMLEAKKQLAAFEEPPQVEVVDEDFVEEVGDSLAETDELPVDIDVNALFSEKAVKDEADSFWEEANQIAEIESGTTQSGYLNFEQARQLGLVPEDEE